MAVSEENRSEIVRIFPEPLQVAERVWIVVLAFLGTAVGSPFSDSD